MNTELKHPRDMTPAELDEAISADAWPRGSSIAASVEAWKIKRRVEILEANAGLNAQLPAATAQEVVALQAEVAELRAQVAELAAKRGPGRPPNKPQGE